MDLNDPRRRLQVLNNANPSLRIVSAPAQQNLNVVSAPADQPKLNVAQPVQYNIAAPSNPTPQAPSVDPNTFKGYSVGPGEDKKLFGFDVGKYMGDFGKTYKLSADTNITSDPNSFLKQFDSLGNEARQVYVNDMQKRAATDPVADKTLRFLQNSGRFNGGITDFIAGANDKFYGSSAAEGARAIDFLIPGKNTLGLDSAANAIDPSTNGHAQFTDAGKAGGVVGSIEKPIFEAGLTAVTGGAAEAGASKIPAFVNLVSKLEQGGRIAQIASKVVSALPGSLGGSAATAFQDAGKGDSNNIPLDVATGSAIDLAATPALGSLIKRGFNFIKDVRGAEKPIAALAEGIAHETNPSVIKEALHVDDAMAGYLANETNSHTVEQVLHELNVDPNLQLSDQTRKTLQDEGVQAINKKDTPYGAEYDPNSSSINFKDQSYVTQDNIYHELGHHIYQTKLTPEEQAAFEGLHGHASTEATGRPGYTPKDLASEDFSDYMRMAMEGKIDQVPEKVRPIIEKYAKIAPEEAANAAARLGGTVAEKAATSTGMAGLNDMANTVLHIPGVGHTPITKQQAEILKDEVNNIPWTPQDRPHLTAGDNVRNTTKELTREELAQVSPNAAKALDNADAKIAQQAEAVGKAQAGTSEAPVSGEVKAAGADTTFAATDQNTPPEKGIKFRDPETKKQMTRSYEDVAAEVDRLKSIPEDQLTAKDKARIYNLEDKMAQFRSENAKYSYPNADEATQKAIQDVMDQLSPAQRQFNKAEKLRSADKAARIKAGGDAFAAAGGGEAGVRAKLSQLKGKYDESAFNPITASEETQKTLLNEIENSNLRDFEKLNTQNALRKIWGATEGKPTTSDINYIRKYFGQDMADAIEAAIQEAPDNWRSVAARIAGTPRALMATGDLSYGLRQGAALGARYPKEWSQAQKDSIKYAVNESFFKQDMKAIRDNDAYELVKDKLGVQLPGADSAAEEAFAGADYAEKIPGVGHVVSGADRAYSGMATKLRWLAATRAIDAAGGPDEYLKVMQDTFGNKADDAMKAYGEVINTLSGRGGKQGGLIDKHMATLSTTLFAPRLWAARLNTLNPQWYARLYRSNPEAAKLALRANGTFLTMAGTVLAAASAAGAQVEWDPRSADFAKIKVGNTRYDILGGLQQNIRLAAQLITGEKINSETGDLQTLGDGFGKPTRFDILMQAFENKENPLLAFASKILQSGNADTGNPLDRQDKYGNNLNIGTEAAKLVIPLNAQGTYDTSKDTGSIVKGVSMNIPGIFGIGVQTYGTTPTKDQGTGANGKISFKGKITDNMVTDNNGNVVLDDKGRPVKVNIPKDATDVEKQALMDSARKSALKSAYLRTLPKEDQALMKLSDDQLQSYVDSGKIDQARFDNIKRLQKTAESQSIGNDYKVPKGVTSKLATDIYKKYSSMDAQDQKYWLSDKNPPEEAAKKITELLNKERSAGLSEFKPSNALAKAYADYEADLNNHPDYTEIDKRNKAKAFQTKAYKLNYNQDQQDIYAEGGSSDLKTLIDNGQIAKEDLDNAIKMDDELYNSGLTGTLKFSKKFRNSYGYAVPSLAVSGSGGFGSGRRSSSGARVNMKTGGGSGRAYLAEYMPSSKSGSSAPAPNFSKKPRTTGISFKDVNLPKKGGKRKVSINL